MLHADASAVQLPFMLFKPTLLLIQIKMYFDNIYKHIMSDMYMYVLCCIVFVDWVLCQCMETYQTCDVAGNYFTHNNE